MSVYSIINALMTPGLTPNESRVYAYFVGRANGARVCWPTVDDISADLHISRRAVIDATTTLQGSDDADHPKPKLIEVRRHYRKPNDYVVLDVPGLHDKPAYAGRRATPAPNLWDEADQNEAGSAPPDHSESEVQISTPVAPDHSESEVQIPAHVAPGCSESEVQIPAHQSAQGCKFQPSGVQIPAPQYVQQERKNKISSSSAGARTREDDCDFVYIPEGMSADEQHVLMVGKEDWPYSVQRHGYVRPPPPKSPRSWRERDTLHAMIDTRPSAEEVINGLGVVETFDAACRAAGIDPDSARYGSADIVRGWLRDGIEASTIREAITQAKRRPQMPTLAYFDSIVRDYRPRSSRRQASRRPHAYDEAYDEAFA